MVVIVVININVKQLSYHIIVLSLSDSSLNVNWCLEMAPSITLRSTSLRCTPFMGTSADLM